MGTHVLAIDQGTTSTRCIVFGADGVGVAAHQLEHHQYFPRPGWVEHDALEIWARTNDVVAGALAAAGLAATDIAAVGITNQRETTVLWDRLTGRPLSNAIVWQDTRTAEQCSALARVDGAGPDRYRHRTGLPLSTYFAGPKMAWLLEHAGDRDPASVDPCSVVVGTIDSWLAWNLTGGVNGGVLVTDVTNASRTLLMDLRTQQWDSQLCDEIGVPMETLAEIRPSSQVYGHCVGALAGVPLAGILGDQQAALFGQTCFGSGDVKNTYGTGCFMLVNTGTVPTPSTAGLLTTVAYQLGDAPVNYALEGSVAVAGAAVQWLRDNLGVIETAGDIEPLAASVPDNGDVWFVPAFNGLFAPRWRPDARGVVVGLTRFATRAHLARAVLEATALQTREVLEAMRIDAGLELSELRVDGGMVANDLMMQIQADVLGVPVVAPAVQETTALGAAYAAGLAVGFWSGLDSLRANHRTAKRWEPQWDQARRDEHFARWQRAVERSLDWV
jgi:glycerol kinase